MAVNEYREFDKPAAWLAMMQEASLLSAALPAAQRRRDLENELREAQQRIAELERQLAEMQTSKAEHIEVSKAEYNQYIDKFLEQCFAATRTSETKLEPESE